MRGATIKNAQVPGPLHERNMALVFGCRLDAGELWLEQW